MKKECPIICTTAFVLLLIGGINWGLVGLFDLDLVEYLFGAGTIFARVIYILIGIAAVMKLCCWIKCKCCKGSCKVKKKAKKKK
ncbi:MAG: DUF378 domain-containing protein [Waddliaceae bacterium]|jgi:uncharacterized membrane protein YuzA (DUF378 family)|nr:DUF378 domain-containing protein [Waddliaceae bacterium]MBT3578766.1 DUF378 domain-containing protein [Waddliaceae bacterium]MBT6927874.1 DUF378 domain-containing protein [Waddliaceae bacterium]MBT7265224.1 DUF378 domain-containing protein [Waddliaceae bacterium]MBT7461766.1 DUF378 domain-containing protein [Waddliaceae bacterium]